MRAERDFGFKKIFRLMSTGPQESLRKGRASGQTVRGKSNKCTLLTSIRVHTREKPFNKLTF